MKNYGFIQPKIEREHYVLGNTNVPFKVIKPSGDWRGDRLPKRETQVFPTFDTFNCTSFNTLNQIEQYLYEVFGIDENYSDRWLGIIAGTKPPGNDPHVVYEAIRKYGLIPESMLPYTEDIKTAEEYFSFKGLTQEQVDKCYEEGIKWLEKFDFKHEWVFDPNASKEEKEMNLKASLKVSPLAFAVYAWATDENGVYIRLGQDTHWTTCFCIDDLQRVFDSYDPYEKNVQQEIYWAKRIYIGMKQNSKLMQLAIAGGYTNDGDTVKVFNTKEHYKFIRFWLSIIKAIFK